MTVIFEKKAAWRQFAHPAIPHGCKGYVWGDCRVFVGIEGNRWHLSISTAHRNPTWEEIRAARYDLVPDNVTMAMILPPRSEYVNIHDFCFHLYQIEDDAQ